VVLLPPVAEPPAQSADSLRIFTCGGLGEIGRNMMVLVYGGQSILIDCGVLFPSQHEPGVDLILPDLSLIDKAGLIPTHVLLTHGHEDHIGAVPYLVQRFPAIVIVGSKLTLAFVASKLREHRLKAQSVTVEAGDDVRYGNFRVRFFAVSHSVPDGLALAIDAGDTRIFHTGDFKVDPQPLDGRTTDLAGFAAVGAEGVDMMLSDSTNAGVEGPLLGEAALQPILTQLFLQATGRIIFACFASNVHRVQQAINATVAAGRQFAFIGRSMIRNMTIASELGYLSVPPGAQVRLDDAIDAETASIVLICTGSQGEPLSALARMARNEHPIHPHPGDLVILSARLIPGNETDVFRVINDLNRRGTQVLYTENAAIHASGHASRHDLLEVINVIKPRYLVPIHGEWRHLRAHAEIGYATGMPEESVILMSNGEVLDYADGTAMLTGTYEFTEIYVDGGTVGLVGARTLGERRQLGAGGLLNVAVAVDEFSRDLCALPVVSSRGLPITGLHEDEAAALVAEKVAEWAKAESHAWPDLERELAGGLRRWMRESYRFEPYVLVTVIPVPRSGVPGARSLPGDGPDA
jgi:ribonuclease J